MLSLPIPIYWISQFNWIHPIFLYYLRRKTGSMEFKVRLKPTQNDLLDYMLDDWISSTLNFNLKIDFTHLQLANPGLHIISDAAILFLI